MAAMEKIDWSECSLVEVKAGVQSGAPVCAVHGCRSTPLSTTLFMASVRLKSQSSLKSRRNKLRRF